MDVRLRNLREHQKDLYNLLLRLTTRCAQGMREWIQESLADEHAAESVLCRWALKLKNAADVVEGVMYEFALVFCSVQVFIEEIDEDFEASTTVGLLRN